jgi:hypothetical protein
VARAQTRRQAYEIDSDGRDVALGVGIIGKSEQQTGLSDTGISDKKELEKVIVSGAAPSSASRQRETDTPTVGRWHERDEQTGS